MICKNQLAILLVALVLLSHTVNATTDKKPVIGWLECVQIENTMTQVAAKIDTGADTSSLNAKVVETFSRNGNDWLRFRLDEQSGNQRILEREIVRYVSIKRQQATSLNRPVVMLNICLDKTCREVEVNLANRENYKYQMLIGRNYLQGYYLVDSSKTFTSAASCS